MIKNILRFKRGTEAHFRIAGRRSTFWREISDSPTPISAEYEYDARRCLPILRQNEFPTFTIREQTYTFPCVSICTANIAILFEIYNSASRRELRPQNKREARRRNEIRPRHDLPAANPRTGRQRFYASALSDRIQSGRCRKQKFSVHLSDKKCFPCPFPSPNDCVPVRSMNISDRPTWSGRTAYSASSSKRAMSPRSSSGVRRAWEKLRWPRSLPRLSNARSTPCRPSRRASRRCARCWNRPASRNSSTPNRRSCSSTKSTASTSRSRTRCWVLSSRAW